MDWFPWYPALYRADTLDLTLEQDGAYRRLIDHYMETRLPLPDNDTALSRIIGISLNEFQAIAEPVRSKFKATNGELHNKRCDIELDRQDNLSRKRSSVAKAAHKKRNKNKKNEASAEQKPGNSTNTRQDKTREDIDKTTTTEYDAAREDENEKPDGGGVVLSETEERNSLIPDLPSGLDRRPSLEDQCEPSEKPPENTAEEVAKAYMDAVGHVYGNEHLLTHPGHGAPQIAGRWLEGGASLDLCRGVFNSVLLDRKGKGEQPPKTLKYFDNPIARAIAEGKVPMPKIKGKDEQTGIHPDAERNLWASRLRGYTERGLWLNSWGNPPNKLPNDIPGDLLAEYNSAKEA